MSKEGPGLQAEGDQERASVLLWEQGETAFLNLDKYTLVDTHTNTEMVIHMARNPTKSCGMYNNIFKNTYVDCIFIHVHTYIQMFQSFFETVAIFKRYLCDL